MKFYILGMLIVIALDSSATFFYRRAHQPPACTGLSSSAKASPSSQFGKIDTGYAVQLAKNINVFCIILTSASSYPKAYSAQNTWIRRCTDYGFVGDKSDKNIRFIDGILNRRPLNPNSWNTLRTALLAVSDKLQHLQYLVKADGDTYMIMENLRYMLEFEDHTRPFLIGHLNPAVPGQSRLSGSAGYVMSRGALQLIINVGMKSANECADKTAVADVQMELCAAASGVTIRDSFDFLGKSRFSSVPIFDMLGPYPNNTPRWYPAESDYTQAKFNLSKLPASPFLVSFKGIDDTMMYVLEYLLYHLRPSGISQRWLSAIKP